MNWRLKALGHWGVSLLPRSDDLGYLMQRRLTKSLPMSNELFDEQVSAADRHLALATRHIGRSPRSVYEFGAGWDLVVPLVLASRGVPHQTVTDVRRLLRPELVADTAIRLGTSADWESLGIKYLAPLNARATGLPAASFDVVTSTNTLEHVPETQLLPLLAECRRLLRADGVMTAKVDYRDHYSYGDPAVGPFAFLRYGPREWRKWNPPSHYQSRLRHVDYLRAFEASGLELVEDEHADPMTHALGTVHGHFSRYSPIELSIPDAWFVLRPLGK